MSVRVSDNLEGLERCPQCAIANPLLEFQSAFFERPTGKSLEWLWVTYKCSSCQDLVAAKTSVSSNLRNYDLKSHLAKNNYVAFAIVPEAKRVDQDLPDRPRRYLEQAHNSLSAPDGAIMLTGSAVDAMLKLKGYEKGSVYDRIEKAVKDHVLTEGMSEWAHAVRLEANKPRHADIEEPHATKEMAAQAIRFAEALGEFLFVLPARIARGTADSEAAEQVSE